MGNDLDQAARTVHTSQSPVTYSHLVHYHVLTRFTYNAGWPLIHQCPRSFPIVHLSLPPSLSIQMDLCGDTQTLHVRGGFNQYSRYGVLYYSVALSKPIFVLEFLTNYPVAELTDN